MTLPVRPAVAASPDYPFVSIDAPVKLDQNEAPDDVPAALKAKVMERLAATSWNRYPEIHAATLAAAIGRQDGWPAAGVVVSPGSNALIPALIQLAALQSRVVTVKPGFALYGLDARLLDARFTEVALRPDFSLDVAALVAELGLPGPAKEQAHGQPAGVLFLAQPHAPTGSVTSIDVLEEIIGAASGWLVVLDEAYFQFSGQNLADLARRHANVIVLRTFSKAWGLAGLRVGYALAGDELAAHLRKLTAPFGLSVLQSVAVQVTLDNPQLMQHRVAEVIRERERMVQALLAHSSWQVFPSHANFLLIRTPDAVQASKGLLGHGVLLRRQDSLFGLEGCIRVTVGTPAENDQFLSAAEQL